MTVTEHRSNKRVNKSRENENVTGEQVLAWARRVGSQKAQSAILENLKETKDFDRTFTRNRVQS